MLIKWKVKFCQLQELNYYDIANGFTLPRQWILKHWYAYLYP